MKPDLRRAIDVFAMASAYVELAGLQSEVEWQGSVSTDGFTESDLLREAAWVILCSGFRESVVRRRFDYISLCFCDWESAAEILKVSSVCLGSAERGFHNVAKLNAILGVAELVDRVGFASLKKDVIADPITTLRRLPFIGPTTVWHLAKNLGYDVAKPDRHLARIAKQLGFSDAFHFCGALALESGKQTRVIDLIVWRYLADNPRFSPLLDRAQVLGL